MKKTILPIFLLLALSGCHERNSLSAPTPPAALPADEIVVAKQPKAIKDTSMIKVPKIVKTAKKIEEIKQVDETKVTAPKVKKIVRKSPKVHSYVKSKQEIFSGGIMTDGLDIGTIRLGKEGPTTRLVFDSFKWNMNAKTPSIRSYETGYYTFTYNPKTKRITGIIDGYRGFSALHGTKGRSFGANKVVKRLYLEKYLDDSGYKFSIDLKRDAKVNIFDLKGPGRIIIDITPR